MVTSATVQRRQPPMTAPRNKRHLASLVFGSDRTNTYSLAELGNAAAIAHRGDTGTLPFPLLIMGAKRTRQHLLVDGGVLAASGGRGIPRAGTCESCKTKRWHHQKHNTIGSLPGVDR
jgi:hypothetical protein